eukprot:2846085-Heterocapsa_arctica.AAC.1
MHSHITALCGWWMGPQAAARGLPGPATTTTIAYNIMMIPSTWVGFHVFVLQSCCRIQQSRVRIRTSSSSP